MTDAVQSVRHDWTLDEIKALFELPFNDLLFQAQTAHRANFDPNAVQISTLLSIKTGACPEDCAYCPQSAHYKTEIDVERLLPLDDVLNEARARRSPIFADHAWSISRCPVVPGWFPYHCQAAISRNKRPRRLAGTR